MRVLTCHHFAYQEVFTTDYEPQTLYAADDKIFVATSQCYIEVHTLTQHGCPLIAKFPTIGTVLQLKYSKTDNFIATLEEKNAKTSSAQKAVRVYLNWPTDASNPQPMRARIAGYMTSLRHTERECDEKRFEVVEIPLKEKPNCIAVDESNGTLAIGVGSTVLMYGFCSKAVAESAWRYEDMKIILELKFSFVISQIAISEEFIACSSDRHLQVVMLRSDNQELCERKENHKITEVKNSDAALPEVAETTTTGLTENSEEQKPIEKNCDPTNAIRAEDDADGKFKSSFNDKCAYPRSNRHVLGGKHSKKSKHSKLHAEAKAAKRQLEAQLRKNGHIFGPLLKPPSECHVTVEYEDTCKGDSLKYLHNSVSTYFYKKFDYADHGKLHSLQLLPVYKPAKEQVNDKPKKKSCCGACKDHERPLLGMCCFISGPIEGYLYKIFHDPELLVTVPYTATSMQVCCTPGMFYVLTATGIEVYSSRCIASALHDLYDYDGINRTLPPPNMEVCLLGLHPFIGLQTVAFSSDFLALFSKHVYEGDGVTEVNWSIYSLRRPKTLVLFNDMKELIERYHRTAVPSSDITHLLKEAHLAIEGSKLLLNLPEAPQYLAEVCRSLVGHLSRPGCEEWNLTLPYFMMSGMTLDQFLKVVVENAKKCQLKPPYGKGALQVLNHVLFNKDFLYSIEQEEENNIIDIFSECDGAKLSQLLTLTRLRCYDPGNALSKLKQWISSCMISSVQKTQALDHLCLVMLYLQVGNKKDAEAVLNQMPEDDIIETCTKYSSLLHQDFKTLHPLACFMWEQRQSVFLEIATRWIQDSHVTVEGILKLLESYRLEDSQASMKITVLEHILSDLENKPYYEMASLNLAEMYLQALHTEMPIHTKEFPKGEHFSERFQWLQRLEHLNAQNSTTNSTNKEPETYNTTTTIKHCLESLLCSRHTSDNLVDSVLTHLQKSDDWEASLDSVLLLCEAKKNPQETFEKILDQYPSVTCQYIRDMMAGEETTKMLEYSLGKVAGIIRELDNHEDSDSEVGRYTEVFKELLDYAAELMDTKTLLQLLPPDASAEFCLPYLRKSISVPETENLSPNIALGAESLASLSI